MLSPVIDKKKVKMNGLIGGLLVLIFSATVVANHNESCLEGYTHISPNSKLCMMVTPPGTWLEAYSMCVLPESESLDSTKLTEIDIEGIRSNLRRAGVSETWLWPSDFTSLSKDVGQSTISWLDLMFYSFHISRWKWLTTSENKCETLTTSIRNQSARSCSPEDHEKLPLVCVLPVGDYQVPIKNFSEACEQGVFLGFEYGERDVCYLMDDRVTELLARKDYPPEALNGRHYTHCEWLGNVNHTDLEERISDICRGPTQPKIINTYSLSPTNSTISDRTHSATIHHSPTNHTTTTTTWRTPYSTTSTTIAQTRTTTPTTTSDPLPMRLELLNNKKEPKNSNAFMDFINKIKSKAVQSVNHLKNRLSKRDVGLRMPRPSSSTRAPQFDCLLCAPSSVGGKSPSLRLENANRAGELVLTLLNFDSNETEIVTCFTDASLSNFTSPNYKMVKITISPLNKLTHARELKFRKTAIEDSFFLRLRRNNMNEHTPLHDLDIETELTAFSEGHYHSMKFLKIPFQVQDEGNYWCFGRDYVTKLPMFTERVMVEIPHEENYQRYLVLVETEIKLDPTIFCQKFGTIMARNLSISDANIELKRINSNEHLHFLFYHVTLQQNHMHLVEAVPNVLTLYIGKNKVLANITSIRKLSSVCSSSTVYSSGQFKINLASTLKGGPPAVFPVQTNGYIVNVVYNCIGDAVDGAVWKEIVHGDPDWKKEWNPSRPFSLITLMNITTELHTTSKNPIDSKQLNHVTDLIKVLLNRGEGTAVDNGQALEDLDKILSTLVFDPKDKGVVMDKRDSNVAILVSDLSRDNPVVGISFTTKNGKDTIEGLSDSTRGLPTDDSEVMVRIPKTITSNYKRLAFAVFSNVQSFYSNASTVRVNSRIIDIVLSNPGTIPDHTKLPNGETIEIYFKPTTELLDSERAACAFWDLQNAAWSTEGCTLDKSTNICRCNHLTHFAQIITGSGARLSPGHQKALEIVSIVGCVLSLLGLLVIVATGVIFKAWRQEVGNQVLLNLTAALTLNLVTYLLVHSGVGGNKGGSCILLGVILHYSILACFCWMLVMSGLQLVRLLTVVGNRKTSKLLLKSSLFAWGVPFIPVAILLMIGPNLYAPTTDNSIERGFCYPTGAAFYSTVLAPVVCIILVNLVAYIAIMCRLFSCFGWGELRTGIQRHGLSDGTIAMRRIRILVFLFFLFGLTWTFAFLAKYIFFAYLFCITATLQGFVIFIFFFVIERKSRGYWQAEFCQTQGKQNYKSSDTLSSVTYSTATHKTSESKSSWYIENGPLPNKEAGTSVRMRNKEGFVESLSQEEQPLKLRYSQQSMTTPEAFSEAYTDLVPLKRVSFDVDEMVAHKSVIPQIKRLKDSTLLDSEELDGRTKDTVNESPKKQLVVQVKVPNLADIKDDDITPDSQCVIPDTKLVPTERVLVVDDEWPEQESIIPPTDVLKNSVSQNMCDLNIKEMPENDSESPKVHQAPVAVKMSNLPNNKEENPFHNAFVQDSRSVASSSSGSSSTASPNAKIQYLEENDDGLAVAVNDNDINIVSVESNQSQDNSVPAVSESKPTSITVPEYQTSTSTKPSNEIPGGEMSDSLPNRGKDPPVTSAAGSSENKVIVPATPMKQRSPFIVSCPITRH